MRIPAHLVRRSVAIGLVAVLVAPLVGAWHHHDVDHDGGVHHIEAAHGGHTPAMTEADSRLPGATLKVPVPAVMAGLPDLQGLASLVVAGVLPDEVDPPPRAPPGSRQSRAPPA